MSDKLVNGDYEKTEGGLTQTEYIDELEQNALLLLRTRKGRFYPDKNFGSRIAENDRPLAEEYAVSLAREALYMLDGVFVKGARRENGSLYITLIINDEEREVSLDFENNL